LGEGSTAQVIAGRNHVVSFGDEVQSYLPVESSKFRLSCRVRVSLVFAEGTQTRIQERQ
jgi:hypothetical protein